MYIQALKSLISKFMQVKKWDTELLKKGVDKELITGVSFVEQKTTASGMVKG